MFDFEDWPILLILVVLALSIISFGFGCELGERLIAAKTSYDLSDRIMFEPDYSMDGWVLDSSEPVIQYNPDDVCITIDNRGITVRFTDEYNRRIEEPEID